MIVARNFRTYATAHRFVATCDLSGPGMPDHLTFEVPLDNAEAVDIDEPNWAALSLLYPAMMMGEDLTIEADLSPMLLNAMRNDLMALMRNYEPLLKKIRINAGVSSRVLPDESRDVMTGFSAGVDSFATFALYTAPEVPPSLRLTALANFHVGSLGPTTGKPELLDKALANIGPHARASGMKLYGVAANLNEVYAPAMAFGPIGFGKTVGFRNAAAAHLLHKGVRLYLPSGNRSYAFAEYGPTDCTEQLDPVLQPLMQSETLRIIPAGAGLARSDKVRLIVDRKDAQENLHPCLLHLDKRPEEGKLNCSRCWKCAMTLMTVESYGKLDDFRAVFDIDYYRANHADLMRVLLDMSVHDQRYSMLADIRLAERLGVVMPKPTAKVVYKGRKMAVTMLRQAKARVRKVIGRR